MTDIYELHHEQAKATYIQEDLDQLASTVESVSSTLNIMANEIATDFSEGVTPTPNDLRYWGEHLIKAIQQLRSSLP